MDFGAATHPGLVRSTNEDGFFASGEKSIFAVADGMGGHAQGEVASQLALEAITRHADAIVTSTPADLSTHLHQALQEANAEILAQTEDQEATRRMGTTMVLATICGDRLYFAHIGDSRLYLLRGDLFIQLTRDHSLVQAMVDRGEITPEEAAIHPLRHQITRVVGGDEDITPEIASQALEPGDQVLLCTDGLSGVVQPEQIKTIMQEKLTAQQKADSLVKAALDHGGPDNITAVVVAYQRPNSIEHRQQQFNFGRPHFTRIQTALIAVLTLLILLASYGCYSYLNPSFYIAPNEQGTVVLFERWLLLPMLAPRYVPVSGQQSISQEDVAPVSGDYGDISAGITVEDKDAGTALLQVLTARVATQLLNDVRTAIDAGNLPAARELLARAKKLGADEAVVRSLESQITRAERPHTLPHSIPAPLPGSTPAH